MSRHPKPLDPDGIRRLIDAIEETPETVIPIHLLTQGTCEAYAVGDPASSEAVEVQSDSLREEPSGIGGDGCGGVGIRTSEVDRGLGGRVLNPRE